MVSPDALSFLVGYTLGVLTGWAVIGIVLFIIKHTDDHVEGEQK